MPKIATAWIAVLKAGFVATIATLGAAPALAAEEDPWEGVNRAVFRFNDTVDTYTLKPLAQGYQKVTPNVVLNRMRLESDAEFPRGRHRQCVQ